MADIETFVLRVFQREVEKQCRYGVIAFNEIQLSLNKDDTRGMWFALQNLLIASANLRKLLWGTYSSSDTQTTKERRERQRRLLRESLGVDDSSPLSAKSIFRNHFEHFDERVEEWAQKSERHNMVDDTIGHPRHFVGLEPTDMLRMFDPATWTLHFQGTVYELAPVIHAIAQLHPVAAMQSQKPHWEPVTPKASEGTGSEPSNAEGAGQ